MRSPVALLAVAVLAGGRSPEREVSLRSGHRVSTALEARGHEPTLVDPAETTYLLPARTRYGRTCSIP